MKTLPIVFFCLFTSCVSGKRNSAGRKMIGQGYELLRSHRLNEAAGEFRRVIALAYGMHDEFVLTQGLMGLGRALYFKSDFSAAIDTISLAITHSKKLYESHLLPEALLVLSNIYQYQGDYDKAFDANRQINSIGNHI